MTIDKDNQNSMLNVITIFILVGGDDRDQEVPRSHLHQEGATGIKTKYVKRAKVTFTNRKRTIII